MGNEIDMSIKEFVEQKSAFEQYFEDLPVKLIGFGMRVLLVVILFIIGSFLIKLVRKLVRKALEKSKTESGNIFYIDMFVKVSLYVILICILGGYFGFDAASFVALLGSTGLTIGLAFQGSLSNLAGGLLILLSKPFKVGDYILIECNNLEGTVSSISLFYTRLCTMDNRVVVVPNGLLANTTLVNTSINTERRVDLSIEIDYKANFEQVREVIMQAIDFEGIAEHDRKVFIQELTSKALVVGVECYVKNADYLSLRRILNEEIKKALEQNGITNPFEQLDVRMV